MLDVFSRRSASLNTDLALDALNVGLDPSPRFARDPLCRRSRAPRQGSERSRPRWLGYAGTREVPRREVVWLPLSVTACPDAQADAKHRDAAAGLRCANAASSVSTALVASDAELHGRELVGGVGRPRVTAWASVRARMRMRMRMRMRQMAARPASTQPADRRLCRGFSSAYGERYVRRWRRRDREVDDPAVRHPGDRRCLPRPSRRPADQTSAGKGALWSAQTAARGDAVAANSRNAA